MRGLPAGLMAVASFGVVLHALQQPVFRTDTDVVPIYATSTRRPPGPATGR